MDIPPVAFATSVASGIRPMPLAPMRLLRIPEPFNPTTEDLLFVSLTGERRVEPLFQAPGIERKAEPRRAGASAR